MLIKNKKKYLYNVVFFEETIELKPCNVWNEMLKSRKYFWDLKSTVFEKVTLYNGKNLDWISRKLTNGCDKYVRCRIKLKIAAKLSWVSKIIIIFKNWMRIKIFYKGFGEGSIWRCFTWEILKMSILIGDAFS